MISRSLIAAGVAAALSSSANAATLSNMNYAGWLLGAYSDDRTGAFSHCAASVQYKSGTYLVFSLGTAGWKIGLANPNWQLPPGASYSVSLQIDRNQPVPLTAIAVSKEQAIANLETSDYLFQLFRRGRLLKIQAPREMMFFDLTNSARVLDLTLACAKERLNSQSASGQGNPFSGTPQPTAPTTDHTAETTAFLANILSAAGVQGFRLLPQTDPKMKPWEVAWTAPNLVGLARIDSASTVDQSATLLTAIDTSQCKGSFATTKEPSSNGRVLLLKTACQTSQPATSWRYSYTLVSRPAGGSYLTGVIETGNAPGQGSPGEAVGPRLLDASVRYLGQ